MKVLRERINKNGNREVTVELRPGETLLAFEQDRHYKLGYPVEDIVVGHVMTDSEPVVWCSIEQRWVP